MATDKRLDQVSQLTDFDYALIVKGTDVAKVTKQQFAELVGNLLYRATTKETLASVVAEQMGAFRTYPLGTITDANDAYSGIFPFNMTSAIANTGGNIGLLIHYSGSDARYATQTCTIFASPSATKIRHKYNGSWSDWSIIQ